MTQSAITMSTGTSAPKTPDATKAATTASSTEQTRTKYAFWLAAGGFGITMILACLVAWFTVREFTDTTATGMTAFAGTVSAIVSPFLALLGTLVGTFFGVQAGASGKAELTQQVADANKNATDANNKVAAFAGQLEPDKVEAALKAYSNLTANTK